jgi:hypothetical protein
LAEFGGIDESGRKFVRYEGSIVNSDFKKKMFDSKER